ncbi:MAG: type II secretion system F family protein [Candidatus Omnitrophota bacterium]
MPMLLLIFILVSSSAWIIAQYVIPFIRTTTKTWHEKRIQKSTEKLEQMFIVVDRKKLALLYTLAPLITGIVGLVVFRNFLGAFLSCLAGIALPAMRIKYIQQTRYRKFVSQLPDGIMIMSSCLKGGLSLLQAIETVADEMPAPIAQEFGMIIKETKMGISLEESLSRLSKRMVNEDLNLMNTAILVARETGGNLPEVFGRLVTTIRAKSNINETVRTMTLQGRAQGVILSALPFVFSIFVYRVNPEMLEQMLKTEAGRIMLGVAALLQIIGIVLIRIFSRAEV